MVFWIQFRAHAANPGRALDRRLTPSLPLSSSLLFTSTLHGLQEAARTACRSLHAFYILYSVLQKVCLKHWATDIQHEQGCRNREEINAKTRERMRRLRASDETVSPEILAARLEARRAAAKRYRERCVSVFFRQFVPLKYPQPPTQNQNEGARCPRRGCGGASGGKVRSFFSQAARH